MSDEREMVERVARAIMQDLNTGNAVAMRYEEFSPITRERFHKVARSAIEAMRMTYETGDALDVIQAKRIWNAGIDAALAG